MYKVTYRCFGPFQHVHEKLLPDSVILQMHHLRLQTHETGYDKHQQYNREKCEVECSCSHDWWRVLRASSRQRWASETRTESADPPLHRHTPHTPDHARNLTRTHSGAYCWNSPEPLSETDPIHHWETHTDRQLWICISGLQIENKTLLLIILSILKQLSEYKLFLNGTAYPVSMASYTLV